MFSKTSVEEYLEAEIKPKMKEEKELEDKITSTVFTAKDRRTKEKVNKKIKKLVDKKKFELSFE